VLCEGSGVSQPARAQGSADADVAGEIRRLAERIDTLQADVRRISAPSLPAEPGWDDEAQRVASHEWLGALEPAISRGPQVPRLLLEALFLAACAAGAALADQDGVAIHGVMVGAWVLVALIEWAASRAERRRNELLSAPPPAPAPPVAEVEDPSWFVPPVERTMHDDGQHTAAATVASLPAPQHDDPDVTVEQRRDPDDGIPR
jgi:hypothetical protein